MIEFFAGADVALRRLAFALGGLLLGLLVERLVISRAKALAARTRLKWDDLIVESARGVPTVLLTSAGVYFALAVGTLDPVLSNTMMSVLTVVIIGAVAVALMRAAGGAVEMISETSDGAIKSPTLVVNLARVAVGMLGVFIILQNLGIDITPLITALGIGGLAVALALQDTLGNLFAGVQIILSKQVRPRDYIRLDTGEEGWVSDVKGRNTTIHTFPDGNMVVLPNSRLASSVVKNYTRPRKAMWVTLAVGVSYDSDLEFVEGVALEVARQALSEVEGGVTGGEPVVRYHSFGGSSIDFDLRIPVREFESQAPVRHELIKRLHRRFNEEGIEIPFPIRTIIQHGS